MDRTRYPGIHEVPGVSERGDRCSPSSPPGQHPSAQQIMIEAGFITLS